MDPLSIKNSADFQRHLNGTEYRLNKFIRCIRSFEKYKSKFNREQLEQIRGEDKELNIIIQCLEQSPFQSNAQKRLLQLKKTFLDYHSHVEQLRCEEHSSRFVNQHSTQVVDEEQRQHLLTTQSDIHELQCLDGHMQRTNQILEDLTYLNETINDVNQLIQSQGNTIDSIADSMTTVDNEIALGTVQIQNTVIEKKRTNRTRSILIIIILVIILILLSVGFLIWKLAFPFV